MKKLFLVFWLLSLMAVIGLIPEPAALWLKIIAVMLLLAHAIEFILFEKTIKRKGDNGFRSFVMTMLYGVLYFKV